MEIIELLLDENDELTGIEAVSLVENPAIEEEWILNEKDRKEASMIQWSED